jgi:peptidoglycan/LPS O-acetylase OafA/YrhL
MSDQKPRQPLALKLVAGMIALEALVVLGLAAIILFEIFAGTSKSFTTAIALFAMVAAAGTFVAFVAVSLLRSKRWARSAALFWQLVQLSVATGSFTGQFANAFIGTALIVPSLIVAILIFRKDVVAATMQQIDRD